jgi:uncharacterized protein YjbI with pentapeptide repeats
VLYKTSFRGARMAGARFDDAALAYANFDLIDADDVLSPVRFDRCKIERTTFLGADLSAVFPGSTLLGCSFSPAVFDVRSRSDAQTIRRRETSVYAELPSASYLEVVAAHEESVRFRLEQNEKDPSETEAWDWAFGVLKGVAGEVVTRFAVSSLQRMRASNLSFREARLFRCTFEAANLKRVDFERALLQECDIIPRDLSDLFIVDAIYGELRRRRSDADKADKRALTIERMLQQIFYDIATAIAVHSNCSIKAVDPDGRPAVDFVRPRLLGANCEGCVLTESRIINAGIPQIRMRKALLSDTALDHSSMKAADLCEAVLHRVTGEGTCLSHSVCRSAKFDGDLTNDETTEMIISALEKLTEDREALETATTKKRGLLGGSRRPSSGEVEADPADDPPTEPSGPTDAPSARNDAPQKALREEASLYQSERNYERFALDAMITYITGLRQKAETEALGAATADSVHGHADNSASSFSGADFSEIDGRGASFDWCDLEAVDFTGSDLARLEGAVGASFAYASLRVANFSNTDLRQANFYRAHLAGVVGFESGTNLQGANFLDSQGLQGGEFTGADLTDTIMPKDLDGFGGVLRSIEQLTRQARILFATLMLACTYSVLTIYGADIDRNLSTGASGRPMITNASQPVASEEALIDERIREERQIDTEQTIGSDTAGTRSEGTVDAGFRLPVLAVAVSQKVFYLVTPPLVLSFFVMFHLKLARIWLEARALPRIFPDTRTADRHLFPWIFASLVPLQLNFERGGAKRNFEDTSQKAFVRLPKISIEQITSLMERGLAILFGWVIPPATLYILLSTQRQSIDQGQTILELGFVNLGARAVGQATFAFFIFASLLAFLTILQMLWPTRRSRFWKKVTAGEEADRTRQKNALGSIGSAWQRLRESVASLAARFAVVAVFVSSMSFVLAAGAGPGDITRVAALADRVPGPVGSVLTNAILSSGRKLHGITLTDIVVPGAELSQRRADFVSIDDGILSSAEFAGTHFNSVVFTDTNLANSNFANTILRRVKFRDSNLADADFRGARLIDTDLRGARGLSANAFVGACSEGNTVLPDDLPALPTCSD